MLHRKGKDEVEDPWPGWRKTQAFWRREEKDFHSASRLTYEEVEREGCKAHPLLVHPPAGQECGVEGELQRSSSGLIQETLTPGSLLTRNPASFALPLVWSGGLSLDLVTPSILQGMALT